MSVYTAYGFRALERLEDSTGGAAVPIIRMVRPVNPSGSISERMGA
jgi:hypothetical protein